MKSKVRDKDRGCVFIPPQTFSFQCGRASLGYDEEIVLLAPLGEDVFPVEEFVGAYGGVRVAYFLLVDAHATLLHHLAGLPLRREHGGLRGEKIEQGDPGLYLSLGDAERRHSFEDIKQSLLVEMTESLICLVAEEDAAGLDGGVVVILAVHHDGDLFGETLLHGASPGILLMLLLEGLDLLFGKGSEDLEIFLGVGVAYVDPELIEFVGTGVARVEPYVAALRLSEFAAVGLGDEGAREGECLAACLTADKFGAGGYVAPLVAASELQLAVFLSVEVKEVVALKELVSELREAQAVACLAVETLLHAVLGHHVVDGDMFSDLAREVEEGYILHPVIIVDKLRAVGCVALEVEELGELFLDSLLVVAQGRLVEEVAFGAFPGGIADHSCGASYERQGLMAAALEMAEHHHSAKVADMQAVGGGIDAEVCCGHTLLEKLVCAGHHGVHHSAPGKFFNKIHCQLVI